MADIQLSRPAANQTQTVTSAADARFVLNFATSEAKLAKSDNGENLIITFEDGAKIEVEGFYTAFTKDNLPTLNVGGQDITGDQLTAILGEDLMPAAGPAAGQSAAQGGRFRSFADADLNGGINRLDGLDIGFDGAAQQDDTPQAYYALADETTAAGEVTPEPTPTPTPGPTPGPEPTPEPPVPDFLKAQDDAYTGGIMNTYTLSNLVANDTLGTIMADNVRDYTVDATKTTIHGGTAAMSDNDLTLTLDGDALQDALYESGARGPIIQGTINTAKHVKPVDGQLEVEYTAQDATGAYTDTATATITVGDNADTMLGGDGKDVAWVAGNTGRIETGNGQDVIVAGSNNGVINGGAGNDSLYVGSSDGIVDGGDGDDKLNFSGTNSGQVFGGLGNDTITVYENAGKIDGGDGGDLIDVVEGSKRDDDGNATNSVYGGAGMDKLVLRGGSSYMHGGDGDDTLKAQGDDDEHYWKSDQDAAERNDAQYATLVGGAGNDNLAGSDGSHHNVFYGDDTNPASTDMVGDDSIHVFNYSHDNTMYGGGGNDTLRISRTSHHNKAYGDEGNDELYVHDAASDNTVHGGTGNDVLYLRRVNPNDEGIPIVGKAHGNKLYGDEGDDTLYARDDVEYNILSGGAGNDALYVQKGSKADDAHHNTLYGGADGDSLYAQHNAHHNVLDGGTGKDTLYAQGNATGNTLLGGDGAYRDDLYAQGNATSNKLYGGDGGDFLVAEGSAKSNELYGESGRDTLYARGNATGNTLDGGEGSDELYAQDYVTGNTLYGREGDDSLYAQGNAAKNSLDGGTGSDTLFAEKNANGNTLKGGDDGDRMYARDNAAHNTLDGEDGGDLLAATGNAANNILNGGTGADTLIVSNTDVLRNGPYSWSYGSGTTKDNVLDGGEGNDVLLSVNNTSNNTLRGGAGDDQLFTDALPKSFEGIPGVTNSSVYSNAVNSGMGPQNSVFEGNAGNDTLYIRGNAQNNVFYGNDAMEAAAANAHTLPGGESDDDVFRIFGTAQNNVLYGQGGNDTFELCTDMDRVYHANTMYGGTGDDLFVTHVKYPTGTSHAGVTRASLMDGGEGNDTFIFHHKFGGIDAADTQGANTVLGGAGDDVIIADSYMLNSSQMSQLTSYNNTFDGGEGNDYLLAGGTGSTDYFQNNTMSGGAGNDVLVIRGGAKNTYEGGGGNDVIDASKGLFTSSYDGGGDLDLLLAQNATGVENLKNIEAIVINGASEITKHFDDKLLTGISDETDAYGWNRGHTEIDPTKTRMTQEGVKDVLEDMGFFWRDNEFEFNESLWSHNASGDRTIGGNDYQQWDSTSGDISILVAESVLKNAQG